MNIRFVNNLNIAPLPRTWVTDLGISKLVILVVFTLASCPSSALVSHLQIDPSVAKGSPHSSLHILGVEDQHGKTSITNMTNEPNPPNWPDSVHVLRPTDNIDTMRAHIKETEDSFHHECSTYTTDYHFSDRRHALLFAPGTYKNLDLQVGYYSQMIGLGKTPDDVSFMECDKGPHVPALNCHIHDHGLSLDTFWRSAENFATHAKNGMLWAVSQAAPLRRVHVHGDLYLHDGAAYASGGHLANSVIDGQTYFGGQQQYLSRNVRFSGGASGGAWSLVMVGCDGNVPEPAAGDSGNPSITVTARPHVRIEKPYIVMRDDNITYELRVPQASMDPRMVTGPHIQSELEHDVRDLIRVRVVSCTDDDPTARIQEALDEGKDVILAPGVFDLTSTIEIKTDNQVLLGIGLATLTSPSDGTPCVKIAPGTSGVRVAGIMFEACELKPITGEARATPKPSSTLVQWGEDGVADAGDSINPNSMFDVFCRVGGSHGNRTAVAIDSMMKIYSGNIIGDNIWLWRADHSDLAEGEGPNYPHISPIFWQNEEDEARVETGIQVFGDDVTIYGLAVEHANGHQTIWSGERGVVHFYQCEFPYDVSKDYGTNNYRGYLVTEHVKTHEAYGAGIYSNFRNDHVEVTTAIEHPECEGIKFINPFTVHLDNGGIINSVINGRGTPARKGAGPTRVA